MKKQFQSKLFRSKKHRMIATLLCGALLLGVTLYWRHEYFKTTEYEFSPLRTYNPAASEMRSKNYRLNTEEISPAIR